MKTMCNLLISFCISKKVSSKKGHIRIKEWQSGSPSPGFQIFLVSRPVFQSVVSDQQQLQYLCNCANANIRPPKLSKSEALLIEPSNVLTNPATGSKDQYKAWGQWFSPSWCCDTTGPHAVETPTTKLFSLPLYSFHCYCNFAIVTNHNVNT